MPPGLRETAVNAPRVECKTRLFGFDRDGKMPQRSANREAGVDHLSSLDASFLHLETPETPMHVASLHVLELPEGYRGDFYEDVKAQLESRLHLARVLHRKLAQMPFELADP